MKTAAKRHPRFWRVEGPNLEDCELSVDESTLYNGQRTCLLRNDSKSESDNPAVMIQTMGAVGYRGKRIQFSAKVKTENLIGEVRLFLKVLDSVPKIIIEDDMDGRGVSGTNEWTSLKIVIDVPMEARYINYGAALTGRGHFWIADLAVSEVRKDVPLTEHGISNPNYFAGPTNFELDTDEKSEQLAHGWNFHATKGKENLYESGLRVENNRPALWICSNAELTPSQGEKSSSSGFFSQKFNCSEWRGQRVRFSADIKCKNVGDWCGLMMWVKGIGETLAFTTMYDIGLCGDSDWQRCSVVLDVPSIAYMVIVSTTLSGNGEAYFSNLSFDAVGADVETTDRKTGPRNITFEE